MASNAITEESDQQNDKEDSDDAKTLEKSSEGSEDKGKEALSLFEEQEKREARKGRKNIARKFITKIINHDDTPGITIDDSSDFLICDSETQIESIKLERQLWRESLA